MIQVVAEQLGEAVRRRRRIWRCIDWMHLSPTPARPQLICNSFSAFSPVA